MIYHQGNISNCQILMIFHFFIFKKRKSRSHKGMVMINVNLIFVYVLLTALNFLGFNRCPFELIFKYNVVVKTLPQKVLSEHDFYTRAPERLLIILIFRITVKSQWLEHLWNHGNLFETWVVQATEG